MDGNSTASAVQNRPPSRETCRRSGRRERDQIRMLGRDRHRDPGAEPRAGLAPRDAAVVRDDERRAPVDHRHHRRAVRSGRDDEREVDVGRVGDDHVVDELGVLLLVDVHRDGSEGARNEQPRHRTEMSSTTSCAARPAAATGSRPLTRPST